MNLFDQPTTTIVNMRYHRYDVKIDRSTIWGNPYSHLSHSAAKYKTATREEAISRYREYILNSQHLLDRLGEIRGKILGCHCKPKSCHGDILVWLCNLENMMER